MSLPFATGKFDVNGPGGRSRRPDGLPASGNYQGHFFYVLLILPAQRRQKKTQEMINALKNGDKVITNGGLYGTIVGIEGDAIQLRIADQVKRKDPAFPVSGLQPESKGRSRRPG